MPNDRAGRRTGERAWTRGAGTHDELLTSARSRRRACDGRRSRDGRPAQARRLSQEVVPRPYRGRSGGGAGNLRCRPPTAASTSRTDRCGSPCSRRSPGGRRRATTARGSCSPRCSTEGLVELGPRRHAVRHRRLGRRPPRCAATVARGWSEDADDRPEGRRVPAHRRGVRARRRVRRHPQRLRLPAAHLQRPRRHAGRHDDPRLLVAADRPGVRALRRDDDATSPSATPTGTPRLHYAATIHHGIDVDAFALHPDPGEHLLFFGRIHPDKGTARGHRGRAPGRAAPRHRRDRPGRALLPTTRSSRTSTATASATSGPVGAADRSARARRRPRPAPPHRLRRAVRLQRRRGDGLRHAGHRLPTAARWPSSSTDGRPGSSSTTSTAPSAPSTAAGGLDRRAIRDRTVAPLRPGDDGRPVRRRLPGRPRRPDLDPLTPAWRLGGGPVEDARRDQRVVRGPRGRAPGGPRGEPPCVMFCYRNRAVLRWCRHRRSAQ